MFNFLRNLAALGFLYVSYKWLKERVCDQKESENAEQTKPSEQTAQA